MLSPGTKLGPYEVVGALGAGGMGEVYRARDIKLNREVALKVLPEAFAKDAERMARFQREAQVLASLNHPNIAAIYGLEESGDVRALVMELVEGPTLAERIGSVGVGLVPDQGRPQGVPLQIDESLQIAKQLAEGLEYAHERGVIHRDLKPANIKVTPDGTVKVLDFGLAKALDAPHTPSPSPSGRGWPKGLGEGQDSPTLSFAATQAGVILGTAAYMSPEQARGKPVDKRADIWAFGVVLHEMLTGKQVFSGETVSDTLAAVITKEPDWEALPASAALRIRQLLHRCLTKDAKQRLRDIGEARIAIEETLSGASDVATGLVPSVGQPQEPALSAVKGSPLQRALPWALAVVFLLGAIISSVSYWRLARAPARAIVSEIEPPEQTQFGLYLGPPVISPDGQTLAFAAVDLTGKRKTMLWVRSLDSPVARPLPGTEGASDPFWSADSRSVGFFADDKLKTIEASGGPAVVVADAPYAGGGSWNRDGTIVFVPHTAKGIYRVSASGGAPAPVIPPDTSKSWLYVGPRFLPDGKHFLYVTQYGDPALAGIYFASLDGKERRLVLREGNSALYASGYLLYPRGNTLMAQAFDPERGQLKGDPHRVAQNVAVVVGNDQFGGASENGILVYQTGGGGSEKRLTWFDRAGKNLGVVGEVGDYYDVRLSPDGAKLASNAGYPPGSSNSEIWVDELARGVRMRLTIDPDTDHGIPVWSPDGNTILFGALQGKARTGIYRKLSNGAGSEELLLPSEEPDTPIFPTSWSRDGRFILYSRGILTLSQADIWVLPLSVERKPRLFVRAPGAAYDGQFSPNARWVAYTSRESGRDEVYVVPFDAAGVLNTGSGSAGASGAGPPPGGPAAAVKPLRESSGPQGGKWQVSSGGGRCPRWRGDGKEIFYLSPDSQMMAAEVEERGNGIEVQAEQVLFRVGAAGLTFSPYDVTPDGKKFIINTLSEQNTPLTLVVNWTANLKQR